MRRDRGEAFLFSADCGFTNDEDGEGYIYSDGSGYYHGFDGSEGYIYSDGSAYYHGADGSDGYKYSDGSGYFHGSDGSDGYKYSDGSGYYNRLDGSSSRYESDEEYDDDDDDNDNEDDCDFSLGGALACLALGLGAVAVASHIEQSNEKARIEKGKRLEEERIIEERRREKQEKRQKERKLRNKRIKAFLFKHKNLIFEYSTNQLIGKHVENVVEAILEAGFNNCKTVTVEDIYLGINKFEGEVEQVSVNGQSWVSAGTMVPYDAEIVVTYHMKKKLPFPYPMRLMIRQNFEDLAQELLNIGFTEVHTMPLRDLKMGWIKKPNSVKQVQVYGVDSLRKGLMLEYDVEITIQYHSYAKS